MKKQKVSNKQKPQGRSWEATLKVEPDKRGLIEEVARRIKAMKRKTWLMIILTTLIVTLMTGLTAFADSRYSER
ncbi:MAG: hypothetical protein HOP19_07595, partial [Acidobacteria bacterium]|nr:hypothetical protein [Acidobacteriota bacterium]